MTTDLDVNRVLLLRRVVSAFSSVADRALEAAGLDLTYVQWISLRMLYWQGASSAAELAGKHDTDAGALSRMLARLEDKGLVQRRRAVRDRRCMSVSLTPEGRGVAQRASEVVQAVDEAFQKGLRSDERLILLYLLRKTKHVDQSAPVNVEQR